MNVNIVFSSFLVVLFILDVPGISGKQRSLKIVVPSKIRYVHHHHTHVVLMKDKKGHKARSPDAKFHHLHYYEDGGGRKNKGVNHHYYIPYLPPQAEDEAEEDESVTKYTIAHPKNNRVFHKPNFISTRPLPPVYEEPFPRKFQYYGRNNKESYHPPRDVMEYYETDPYFPVVVNPLQDHATSGTAKVEYEYKEDVMPVYGDGPVFDGRQLFYPENSYYNQKFPHVY